VLFALAAFFLARCSCSEETTEGDGLDAVDAPAEEGIEQPADPAAEEIAEDPGLDDQAADDPGPDPAEEDLPVEDMAEEDWVMPDYPCFPSGPAGDYIGSAGCFDMFASCDPADASRYLLVKNGEEGGLSMDDLSALKDGVEDDVMALPFVIMFGIGLSCCDGTTNAGCWVISLQGNSGVTIRQMAERLGALDALCGAGACIGITVEIPAPSAPRCDGGDPGCVPVPMCDPDNCPGGARPDPGCCPECGSYDPSAGRTLSIGSHADALVGPGLEYLEVPAQEEVGECAHDGECVLNGCGQYCCSYDDLTFISTCECYPGLSRALCGCVDGRCRWFHQ
jgi:hypothetical protein